MGEDAKGKGQVEDENEHSISDAELVLAAMRFDPFSTESIDKPFVPPAPFAPNLSFRELTNIWHFLRMAVMALRGNRGAVQHLHYAECGIDRAIYPRPDGAIERKLFFLGWFLQRIEQYCRLPEELRIRLRFFYGIGHFLAICDERFSRLECDRIPEYCLGLTWQTSGSNARGWIKIAAELAASVQAFDYETPADAQKDLKKRWSERDKSRFPDPQEPLYDIPP